MAKSYKSKKKGAGRFVQLSESLMQTEAWATLKPGPMALYVALKRRYNGRNNGRLILSYRDAAKLLNVHRNTITGYFSALEERGLICMTQGAYLGPDGIGQSPHWALSELATCDGKPATMAFRTWRKAQKPVTETRQACHNGCDTSPLKDTATPDPVLKIVTR
ncbi:hypothetical protein [Marinovum sp.]|uniref:hypothetical protein n=1 Tax=Marinovum sp. TaxID=2024839 RepID=UPI002B26BC54|nr:hypothetical protein [Marinovum sp.]